MMLLLMMVMMMVVGAIGHQIHRIGRSNADVHARTDAYVLHAEIVGRYLRNVRLARTGAYLNGRLNGGRRRLRAVVAVGAAIVVELHTKAWLVSSECHLMPSLTLRIVLLLVPQPIQVVVHARVVRHVARASVVVVVVVVGGIVGWRRRIVGEPCVNVGRRELMIEGGTGRFGCCCRVACTVRMVMVIVVMMMMVIGLLLLLLRCA